MGAADVVPGVSGGTIAFISGIYMELIDTIKSLNINALRILKSEGPKAAWQHINGNFLVVLLSGILVSLFSLARVMQFLLAEHPLPLWSFFFGLIVGSVIYLLRQHPFGNWRDALLFVLGSVAAWSISVVPAVQLEGTHSTMFFAGSIALCAMILPGISGSFILVLLGFYPVFIGAIANFQVDILVVFGLERDNWFNAVQPTALLAVEALPGHCDYYHVASWCRLSALKQVLDTALSHSEKTIVLSSQNLWPGDYLQLVGRDPQSLYFAMLFGLLLVLGLEYAGSRYREKHPQTVN